MVLELAFRLGCTAWRGAASLRSPFAGAHAPCNALDALARDGYAVIPGYLRADDASRVLSDALALERAGLPITAGVGGVVGEGAGASDRSSHVDREFRRTSSVWLHQPFEPLQGVLGTRFALLRTLEALRSQLARHSALPLDGEATSLAYLYYPEGGFYRRHVDRTVLEIALQHVHEIEGYIAARTSTDSGRAKIKGAMDTVQSLSNSNTGRKRIMADNSSTRNTK